MVLLPSKVGYILRVKFEKHCGITKNVVERMLNTMKVSSICKHCTRKITRCVYCMRNLTLACSNVGTNDQIFVYIEGRIFFVKSQGKYKAIITADINLYLRHS